jgi:hypothetical protein
MGEISVYPLYPCPPRSILLTWFDLANLDPDAF